MRPDPRLLALLLVFALAVAAAAQPVEYTLTFPAPQERWMQVEVRFPASPGEALEMRMSRSSPGRYATHEFGKNLYALEARGGDGRRLDVTTVRPDVWRVTPTDASVTVSYRLFGDRVDGTYFAVDETHAHINAPAVYLWAPALADRESRVRLVAPDGLSWRAYTQLFPVTGDAGPGEVFSAPNLQYLMDSPIEFSDAHVRSFQVPARDGGPAATIRVVVHHLGTEAQVAAFAADIEKLVLAQRDVFGELPAFDAGTYTFLMDYLPWARGDGMEHRNSTVCTLPVGFDNGHQRHLGTVSHEFFHIWNVERIRPASLEPFDYTQANMTEALWLAEGFTSYYGELTLRRAGLTDDARWLNAASMYANEALNAPGVRLRSAVEMSRLAPFVDAAVYVDRTNWENTYLSYYMHGASIALGLDLTLRTRSDGQVTLDDYMRVLWREFGVVPGSAPGYVGRPYTMDDLRAALATASGDAAFAAEFFDRHVEGREPLDFPALFEAAGLSFSPRTKEPYVGYVSIETVAGRPTVASTTFAGTPVYDAGLHRDAEIVSLGGRPVRDQAEWDAIVGRATPGATLDLVFVSRGRERRATLDVTGNPRRTLVPLERTGGTISERQRTLRDAWMDGVAVTTPRP